MNSALKTLHSRQLLMGLLLALLGVAFASCSAADEAPYGGRAPILNPSPSTINPPPPSTSSPATSSSAGALPIAHPGPPYPVGTEPCPWPPYPKPADYVGEWPPPPSEWWGLKLSPLEKIIANTCPTQVWSRHVPDQDCSNHSECGDGFCDRGHCNVIWTGKLRAGMPCEVHKHCKGFGDSLCIEGRCSSCLSDEECENAFPNTGYVCDRPGPWPRTRTCGPLGPKARRPKQSPP